MTSHVQWVHFRTKGYRITMGYQTVSHFSYAPLLNVKFLKKNICYIYSETTNIKRIYICISHRNFFVIKRVKSVKMDLEGHYPQNTISHCIISNENQITLHFFQDRI